MVLFHSKSPKERDSPDLRKKKLNLIRKLGEPEMQQRVLEVLNRKVDTSTISARSRSSDRSKHRVSCRLLESKQSSILLLNEK
jgi:hypothetical protein